MESAVSLASPISDAIFFLVLALSIASSIMFGSYWLSHGGNRSVALVSISIYVLGCILILLFALSTTSIAV